MIWAIDDFTPSDGSRYHSTTVDHTAWLKGECLGRDSVHVKLAISTYGVSADDARDMLEAMIDGLNAASTTDQEAVAAEAQITPQMLACARESFRKWVRRWDGLVDGLPGDADIDQLLRSVIGVATGQKIDPLTDVTLMAPCDDAEFGMEP